MHRTLLVMVTLITAGVAFGGEIIEYPLDVDPNAPKPAGVFMAYEGDPQPTRRIARVEVSSRKGASLQLLKVNGIAVPPGIAVVEVLPGRPVFELRCVIDGKETIDIRSPTVDFPAGWLSKVRAMPGTDGTCGYLWIVFEKLRS
jgi:hypothetical protein